jgi:predicted ATP-grasp superfamily ATP-dependent carboligase
LPVNRIIVVEPYNGGLALARRLVRGGERPLLLLTRYQQWMAASRGVDAQVVPDDDAEASFGAALDALRGRGPVAVITGADRSTEWLASRRSALPEDVRTFESATSGHRELIGKTSAYEIARAAGVAVPWERSVTSLAELAGACADAPFPCVLKPVLSHPFRQLFGDERVFVVHDAQEAADLGGPALEAGIAMMLSEYVPGGDDDVEEAIVVRTAGGDYPVHFGCRKLRQYPSGFGAASLCVSAPIGESMELARAVLDQAGFTGVVGVETKRHAETGVRYFIEANVRLPTQWGLGDASGVDASRRTVRVLTGESVGPQPAQRDGVRLVFPELELPAALAIVRRDGAGAIRKLLRQYRGVREVGLFDPRDPRPLFSRAAQVSRQRRERRNRR